MSNETIFKSNFTLAFENKGLSKDYYELIRLEIRKANKAFTILDLIFNLSALIPFLLNTNAIQKKTNFYETILALKIIFICIDIILICLSFTSKNHVIHKSISIFLYISIFLFAMEMKSIIADYTQMNLNYFNFIYFFEFLLVCYWHFMRIFEFFESFFINLSVMIISICLFFVLPSKLLSDPELLTTLLIMIIGMIGISYFITREVKTSFFFFYQMKIKNKWYENIINHLNSGFIHVKGNQVKFINNTLIKTLSEIKKFQKISYFGRNHLNTENSRIILETILSNIDNKNSKQGNNINRPKTPTSVALEKIKTPYTPQFKSEVIEIHKKENLLNIISNSCIENAQKFSYIGRGELENIFYEIHAKCDVNNEYQIIFNDITRTKLYEEKSAEFKYKNLLLAKIAHEFKNPIICILELAAELQELLGKSSELKEKINLISSFGDYLLILIKDLDYFSCTQLHNEVPITKSKVHLSSIINFCKEIANSLIKRSKKDNNLTFVSKVKEEIMEEVIKTDDIKLKQILVNLISNAVKFTNKGKIELEVVTEGSDGLRFTLTDTGIGVKPSQAKFIFTPFSKMNNELSNKFGAGLGLSIASDLTRRLGKKIQFSSQVNKGTKFWFSLPNAIDEEPSSKKTIKASPYLKIIETQNLSSKKEEEKFVIVADDEDLPRKANIRILTQAIKNTGKNIKIIESDDGVETIKLIYETLYRNNKKIIGIISDENMKLIDGVKCAKILDECNITKIPYYLVTAYENMLKERGITKIFSKPLRKSDAEYIVNSLDKL